MRTIREAYNTSIELVWDSPLLSEHIENMFAPWGVQTQNTECAERIYIESANGFYRIQPGKYVFSAHTIEDAVYRIENALTLHFQELLSHFLQIHAACIDCDGKGIVPCGAHGAGKSTLALTALAFGMKVLGDDIILVNENLMDIHAFPRPIKAKGHTLHIQPSVIPSDIPVYSINQDFSYIFYYIPPGMYYSDTTRLHLIVFPKRDNSELNIRELGEVETLSKLLHQGFNYVAKKDRLVTMLTGIIRNATSYEISYRESRDLIDALRGLL